MINEAEVLGLGSGGTIVYSGTLNGRPVAVKRMLLKHSIVANNEIRFLQRVDLHPNVMTYFDKEEDENFVYLALEKCEGNLENLIHLMMASPQDRNNLPLA